jgi:selenocysteine-specific elongation factor
MKNIIIGTAGHVDHGKTCLIKALTGIDTDRLKEEKKRGITIDIGFAWLDLPSGEKAGIVDVPGHEKFIKNMLAGASGMDMVLFVVAADEGVMPQTREHLGILSLLDVKNGIVVLTKTDLVDEEMMEIVRYDLQCELKGTFLEHAPVVPVSAYTGQGLEELKSLIYKIAEGVQQKDVDKPFRLPVDRVFIMDGFGTVITGTLTQGRISVGDEAAVYPGGRMAKIRKLQVHGQNVDTAFAGQRVALNLASIKKDEVARGDTLAAPGSMDDTMMLDARLHLVADTARTVENGSTLHLYHGTRHMLCRAVLLDRDSLHAGESCLAQLRLPEPIAAQNGDHFVVRFYSPVETVGGGVILEANPAKHKRMDQAALAGLAIKESGSRRERILQAILEYSPRLATTGLISKRLFISEDTLRGELASVADQSRLVQITGKIIVHESYLGGLQEKLEEILAEYHAKNPLQAGMRKDELRGRLLPKADLAVADRILDVFAEREAIRLNGQRVALSDFSIRYTDAQMKIRTALEKIYAEGGYTVPNLDDVQAQFASGKEAFRQVLQSMLDNRVLVCISPQIFLHRDYYNKAIQAMQDLQDKNGVIALGDFRDALAASRKYAYAFLEYCDRNNITQRTGDLRKMTDIDATLN